MHLSQSLDEIETEIDGFKAAMEDVSRLLTEASEQAQQTHDEWVQAFQAIEGLGIYEHR